MAGGGLMVDGGPVKDFGGKLTASVIITCIVAASGGLIFGYDIGISGGVTTMASFLGRFFPSVLRKMKDSSQNEYCVYNSEILTSFTSSLYIAGLVSSLIASSVTRALGRQAVMLIGAATFFIGSAINAAAVNVEMLILGRILLGFGVGFTNQATPVYLSEMAPARWRGALNTGFQFFIAIGVVAANLTNYAVSRSRLSSGWRLSLGLAGAPAAAIAAGALSVPDTPASLASRGRLPQARAALCRVRGSETHVDEELDELVRSIEAAKDQESSSGQFRRLVWERRHRPHLVVAVALPFFQQMTGINVIAFYAPVLFRTVGFGSDPALMAAVVLGSVNLVSILVSTFVVDRYGRKVLFIQGGIQMIVCQVGVAWILAAKIGTDGEATLSRGYSVGMLVLMCLYAAGFGWSWGPLSWLVPSEVMPVEVRSAGQSVNVAVNLGITFVLTQTFLAMLCAFKYGTFLFYAGWNIVMTVFVVLFLPETKGVPLQRMEEVWAGHWFWRRFVVEEEAGSVTKTDNVK
ncbi:Sugar transport protein 5 [Acorus calamus]|uniref:Sugar transport protein 5 n=1 Tax=Acorus calamus TaxID=4465 RepID=A0AAV9DMC1_ACOCL|nr:Sugar transport protein 5 [Acorus calamus]